MAQEKRSTYRHGNVREEAIRVALELVEAKGHPNISIRAIAGKIGVAHRALYNHFSDKDGLLDAVATEGFDQMANVVESCTDKASFISAYLDFSLSRPFLYALMMSRPHATMSETPALQTAVHRVITVAMKFFGSDTATPEENRRAVMKATILLHGGLVLRGNGILDVFDDAHFIRELSDMLEA